MGILVNIFSAATIGISMSSQALENCPVDADDCKNFKCCYSQNIAYQGKDLVTTKNASSDWECQQQCQNQTECKFFTFNASRGGKGSSECRLMKDYDNKSSSMYSISGPRWCTQDPVERRALVALYDSLGGPNWIDSQGWNTSKCYCGWSHVLCTQGDHYQETPPVASIQLNAKNLSGNLNPSSLSAFKALWWIRLDGNPNLVGPLPDLPHVIEVFSAYGCGFHSELPANWGQLPKLHTIELHENKLYGELPKEWANLTGGGNSILLYLSQNMLSGTLPSVWGNMTNLKGVWLYGNKEIHGPVPRTWANLKNLTWIVLKNASGQPLPTPFGQLNLVV